MGRLIDADKLIQCLRNDPLFENIEQFGVTGVIGAQRTVDAVPVVRCIDCKHFDCDKVYGVVIPGTEFCDLTQDERIAWNDYCSRGEYKWQD